jgi:uncharacterized protein YciI
MQRRSMLALAAAAAVAPQLALGQAAGPPPRRYFALMHTPGPAWDHAKGFRDQTGIAAHVGYMSGVFDQKQLVLGGPFLDESGGMMILDVATLEDAQAIANGDPTVKAGLLVVAVKPWLAVFSRP